MDSGTSPRELEDFKLYSSINSYVVVTALKKGIQRPDTKPEPAQWRHTFVTISCLSCLLKSFQGNPVQIVVIKL